MLSSKDNTWNQISQSSEIEKLIKDISCSFSNLDILIENVLTNDKENIDEIQEKLLEIKKRIDLLEADDESQHGYFKYIYHTKSFCYLKVAGKEREALIHAKLSTKYEKYNKSSTSYSEVENDNNELNNIDRFFSNPDAENDAMKFQERIFCALEQIWDSKVLQGMKKILENINKCYLNNFSEYLKLNAYQSNLNNLIDEAIIALDDKAKDENNQSDSGEDKSTLISYLDKLKFLSGKAAYVARIKFINGTLVAANPVDILFDNMLLTEENIIKRYRQLSLCFHPDKTRWLLEKDKVLGIDLINLIKSCKEKLTQKFEEESSATGKFIFHKQRGNEFWKIARDYQYAANKEWGKLTLLSKLDISYLSPEELKIKKLEYIRLSYEEYRACCKVADKNNQFKYQVELRGTMALCLFASQKYLEAQLYAISAIQLIFKKSHHATEEQLRQAKKILDKVKGITTTPNNQNLGDNISNNLAVVKVGEKSLSLSATIDKAYSFSEKQDIKNSIDQDLANIATQLIINSDRNLVNYQSAQEDILRAKRKGNTHKMIGGAAAVTGLGLGGFVAVTSTVEVLQGIGVVAGTALGGPVFAVIGGLATIGLGIWGGYTLWKKGNTILEEPDIREKLNVIMKKSLFLFDEGKHNEFIQALSEKYKEDDRLLQLTGPADIIDSKKIIASLLEHGFRPDGIAYLLNLIGEALSSGKIKIGGVVSQKDLIARAKDALHGTLDESLEEAAKILDERIRELRKGSYGSLKSHFANLKDLFQLTDYTTIAKEHVRDAEEMPFKARLEEMRNIARMNIAIIRIVNGGTEEFSFAKELIEKVRDSVNNNYQFISKSKTRLEVLEDFLWVVSGQTVHDNDIELLTHVDHVPKQIDIEILDNNYVVYLNANLEKTSSNEEKINLYNKKAGYYLQQAQKEEKSNYLSSLRYLQIAKECYAESLNLKADDQNAAIGFAKCLLKLSKYKQVIEFLSLNKNLSKIADYWLIGSIAHRKMNNYNKAQEFINEALLLDPSHNEADKQRKLITKLKAKKEQNYLSVYENTVLNSEEDYFNLSRSDEVPFYKILSIDGGGIRGILPALWLSEIERKSRRPISHMFNMAAGTSTGGIIAAGLSAPHIDIHQVEVQEVSKDEKGNTVTRTEYISREIPSSYRPRYSAFDILKLYTDKPQQIFTTETSFINRLNVFSSNLTTTKYTEYGRLAMFNHYFGQTRLDQSLMDLVIPAANESNLTHTHLFTKYGGKKDCYLNETLVNTLMGTTAAPTFFPSHRIPGKGIFVDGGVHTNNPSSVAYHEAIKYKIPHNKIFMLSMGTGSYIPDPLHPELYRGKLFWAQNLHKVALSAQEGNTDIHMYHQLGDFYQRWQVWLEEPITLDAYQKNDIDNLLDIGHQYIEELYDSEDNSINKILEFLDTQSLKEGIGKQSFFKPDTTDKNVLFQFNNETYTDRNINQVLEKYKNSSESMPTPELALRRAASKNHIESVKILVTHIMDINAQDANPNSRKTALHWAVINKHNAIVKILINNGALPDIKDAAGKMAYDYVDKNDAEMLSALQVNKIKLAPTEF